MKKLVFHAHKGKCPDCGGVVKILWPDPSEGFDGLRLDNCNCFMCGNKYKADTQGLTKEEWINQQWDQKEKLT